MFNQITNPFCSWSTVVVSIQTQSLELSIFHIRLHTVNNLAVMRIECYNNKKIETMGELLC